MAYRYKLETLLRVRLNYEEQCQQKLAHELFILENHKKFLEDLYRQRENSVRTLEEKKKQQISAALFSFYVEAIANSDRQIFVQHNAIEAQEGIIRTVRNELAEKVKDRKIVERLKEKDFQAYMREQIRKEQIEIDEMVMLRFGKE